MCIANKLTSDFYEKIKDNVCSATCKQFLYVFAEQRKLSKIFTRKFLRFVSKNLRTILELGINYEQDVNDTTYQLNIYYDLFKKFKQYANDDLNISTYNEIKRFIST